VARTPSQFTIAKPGEYSPEEIRAGLQSGKFRQIGLDDKVDVTEGGQFVLIPKDHIMPLIDSPLATHLPAGGVEHRILDIVSSRPSRSAQHKTFLHRAHHFAFGVEASQVVLDLAGEPEWIERYAGFAPHPFDAYTVSLWTGAPSGMVEVLLAVHYEGGEPYVEIATLPWGQDEPRAYNGTGDKTWTRDDLYANMDAAPHDQRLGWVLCDAFRLILAQPRLHTINKGPGNRHALRKGKRVTFYSKSEIKIDLDAATKVRTSVRTGNGHMMPVYQYRAHLCHSGGQRGCEHVWIRDEERETPFWTCDRCGRKRWHRRAGSRGSAEVGYVRQTYKVRKGHDE
jgi:hypothetical protein